MGRPARIDREAVLTAALAIADERGLAAVTMHSAADRIGVTPMALYRHVAGKAGLLDGLVERLLTGVPPRQPGDSWSQRLSAIATAVRGTAHRHPHVFPLLLQRPVSSPGARKVRDEIHRALREAGVPPDRVARAERLISTAILGFAVSEVSGRFGRHSRQVLDADFARLQELLGLVVDAERGP